jgi:ribosome-binding protein aMBF1 (putative translation factor)
MDARKMKALEEAGWRFGTVQDLLQLSDEEAMVIEIKVALAIAVQRLREKTKTSQAELAKMISSSQSRIAKLEHGDASIDLYVRALAAMGATKQEIARELGRAA